MSRDSHEGSGESFGQGFGEAPTPPVEVPHTELSADALRGVIESFVLREGTEYGERDFSLEQKVSQVLRQLERGEARILFDPDSETVNLVVADRPRVGRPDGA